MEIGRFATASGLTIHALRRYDEVGVLTPASDSFFRLTVENWLAAGTPSSFGLLVDDVDGRHARALALGATEISPPTDYGWKPRCSVIDDPSGNRVQLSQG